MKKVLSIVMALLLVGAVFAGCAPATDDGGSEENVIRIGVFEPLTGDSASGGKKELLGIQYANAETPTVTLGDVEYKVEVVYSDNGSTTDKAPSAAATLVDKEVAIVLGSYGSGVSMAASDTFNQAGLAALGITCTNPNVTKGNDHYF